MCVQSCVGLLGWIDPKFEWGLFAKKLPDRWNSHTYTRAQVAGIPNPSKLAFLENGLSRQLFFSYSTLETTVVVCESAFCWSMSKGRHVVLTCPDFFPDLPTIHLVQTPECTQSNNMEGTTCALEGEPFKTQTKTSQIWQQDEWLGLAKCRQLHNTPPEYIKVHRQPRRHTTIC